MTIRPRYALGATAALALGLGACGPSTTPMTCAPQGTPEEVSTRPSPFDSAMLFTDTMLQAKLCYSRPSARGRLIFGGLIAYDTLWRTGANEATALYLSQAAEIAGIPVEPGDYSIYTVPSPGRWMVVVNASANHWGITQDEVGVDGVVYHSAYTGDIRAQEIGRAPIVTEEIPFVEQLTASFESTGGAEHRLLFDWETTRVVVPIRILND